MVLAQNKHIDQWNRRESPEMSPQLCSKLIYDKGGKYIQCRKTFLMTSDVRKTVQLYAKESNWTTLSHLYKNKLKMD